MNVFRAADSEDWNIRGANTASPGGGLQEDLNWWTICTLSSWTFLPTTWSPEVWSFPGPKPRTCTAAPDHSGSELHHEGCWDSEVQLHPGGFVVQLLMFTATGAERSSENKVWLQKEEDQRFDPSGQQHRDMTKTSGEVNDLQPKLADVRSAGAC